VYPLDGRHDGGYYTVKDCVTIDVLPRTPGNNVYVGFMVWSNFTATKCRVEAKHWGLRKSRNATSLNSRFKSLDTLKVKIISVTFRRVIRTNHKKASKIWRHENIQLGGCQS